MALSKRDARLKAKAEARATRLVAEKQAESGRVVVHEIEAPGRTAEERRRQAAQFYASLRGESEPTEREEILHSKQQNLVPSSDPAFEVLEAKQEQIRQEREDYLQRARQDKEQPRFLEDEAARTPFEPRNLAYPSARHETDLERQEAHRQNSKERVGYDLTNGGPETGGAEKALLEVVQHNDPSFEENKRESATFMQTELQEQAERRNRQLREKNEGAFNADGQRDHEVRNAFPSELAQVDPSTKREYAEFLRKQMAEQQELRGRRSEDTSGFILSGRAPGEEERRKREYAAALEAQMSEARSRRNQKLNQSREYRAIFADDGAARDFKREDARKTYANALRKQMHEDAQRKKLREKPQLGSAPAVISQFANTADQRKAAYAAELRRQIQEKQLHYPGSEKSAIPDGTFNHPVADRLGRQSSAHRLDPSRDYFGYQERPTVGNIGKNEVHESQLDLRHASPEVVRTNRFANPIPTQSYHVLPSQRFETKLPVTAAAEGYMASEHPARDIKYYPPQPRIEQSAEGEASNPTTSTRLPPFKTPLQHREGDMDRVLPEALCALEQQPVCNDRPGDVLYDRRGPLVPNDAASRDVRQLEVESQFATEIRRHFDAKESRRWNRGRFETRSDGTGQAPPGYRIGPTGQLVRVDPRDFAGHRKAQAAMPPSGQHDGVEADGLRGRRGDVDDVENGQLNIGSDWNEEAARKAKAEEYARQLEADLAAREEKRRREATEAERREAEEERKLERERAELEAAYKRNEPPKPWMLIPTTTQATEQEELSRLKREKEELLRREQEAADDARVERERAELAARLETEPDRPIPVQPDKRRPPSSESRVSNASSRPPPPPSIDEDEYDNLSEASNFLGQVQPSPKQYDTLGLRQQHDTIQSSPPGVKVSLQLRQQEDKPLVQPQTPQSPNTPGLIPPAGTVVQPGMTTAAHVKTPHLTISDSYASGCLLDTAGWVIPPSREAVYSYKTPPECLELLPKAAAALESALETARRSPRFDSPLKKAGAVVSSPPPSSASLRANSCLVFPDGTAVDTKTYEREESPSSSLDLAALAEKNRKRLQHVAKLEVLTDEAIANPAELDDALERLISAAANRPTTSSIERRPPTAKSEDSLPNAVRWAYQPAACSHLSAVASRSEIKP